MQMGEVRTKTQGDARVSLSGWSIAKSGEPVAGPGHPLTRRHWILRRVPVGGRYLGPSRAISFHEAVVTAALAASSHGKAIPLARAKAGRRREGAPTFRGRGRGDRGVRGSIDSGHRGKKTPTLDSKGSKRARGKEARQSVSAKVRRSVRECRETLGPPIVSSGALVSGGRPRWATSGASWERTRCGCT